MRQVEDDTGSRSPNPAGGSGVWVVCYYLVGHCMTLLAPHREELVETAVQTKLVVMPPS